MSRTRDKLEEAHFFLQKLKEHYAQQPDVDYYLSAFISSSRSVIWVMQSEYSNIRGWRDWYNSREPTLEESIFLKSINEVRIRSEKKEPLRTSTQMTVDINERETTPELKEALETLVDEGGDCEDTSILAAALLDALNYDVILVAPPGHMAVGVNIDTYGTYYEYEGEAYFYLETTGEGWEIGERPENYKGVSVYVYPLNPIPVITHDWTGTQRGSILTLNIEIENVGTAMAEDIRVYAAFDSEGDYVWNPEESDQFDLNFGANLSIQLVLDVPSNKYTRIIVGVLDSEGHLTDVSYSEWFNT